MFAQRKKKTSTPTKKNDKKKKLGEKVWKNEPTKFSQ